MRILYLYCHPLPDSFHGAIRAAALTALRPAGHAIDLLDLYAESFQPALTAEGQRNYLDSSRNQEGIESYVTRLRSAQALIAQFPTWSFGPPAMFKGFLDRLLVPGVAIDLSYNPPRPMLDNIKWIVGVVTYGQPRLSVFWMGDPSRKVVTRFLPWFAGGKAKTRYCALYNVDRSTEADRRAYLAQVERAMRRL